MRYEITEMLYNGSSRSPVKGRVFNVDPGTTQWDFRFEQEYRWNTGGDKDGFEVTPVFRDLHPDFPNREVRIPTKVSPPR